MFALPPALAGSERLPTDAEEIVLARRVWPDGRTRAYVCGRAATQADLQELGSQLLSFYGQHEHRKLMLSTAQLELLDAYCGPAQLALRDKLRDAYERVRELEARAAELRELAGARDRELDLLTFELEEIEAAAPTEAEQAGARPPSATGCATRRRSRRRPPWPRTASPPRRGRGPPSCWPRRPPRSST